MPLEEDDPVVASYDVFISPPTTFKPQDSPGEPILTESQQPQPKFYVLQYPSHRPASKPYHSSRSQKPTSLRIKRHTGIFEVDVPLLTYDNYNEQLGSQYGKVMHDSHTIHPTTGHGLSGGFAQNHSSNQPIDVDSDSNTRDTTLRTQTLGGKVALPTDKDPVYMLATLSQNSKQIHLRHLDALVQMRPQLHHIDAADEAKRRTETTGKATNTTKTEVFGPDGKVKLETKAIELKVKDSTKDDPKDRNLNWNAKLLRAIQNDPWVGYDWVEKGEETFREDLSVAGQVEGDGTEGERPQLKSMLDNDEWLNKMSSPGIELRTRLKGRDRERARRKRQERLRAAKAAGATVIHDVEGSDTMPSEDDEDVPAVVEATVQRPESPEVQIKQESAATSAPVVASATPPKKRGRPPKNKATETVSID